MFDVDEEQARRLGDAVRQARLQLGDPPQTELALRADISVATYQKIEGGTPGRYQPRTMHRLLRVLRWQEGSLELVVNGGSPLPEGSPRPVVQEVRNSSGEAHRQVVIEGDVWTEPMRPDAIAAWIAGDPDADHWRLTLTRLLATDARTRSSVLRVLDAMLDALEAPR